MTRSQAEENATLLAEAGYDRPEAYPCPGCPAWAVRYYPHMLPGIPFPTPTTVLTQGEVDARLETALGIAEEAEAP